MITHALVFTDLDGTLLDHHSYSFAPAKPALALLSERKIPVILNSSKTIAEIEAIAGDLSLDTAIIAENGSLIRQPNQAEPVILGKDYAFICQKLDQLREDHGYLFAGFHDWTHEEISDITGLPIESAARAAQRQASEPMIWKDTKEALDRFTAQLNETGLTLKRGGRFWHVMGDTDKVKAMQYLIDEYRHTHQIKPTIIALGDGPNDQEMISAADIGIVVFNPDGIPLAISEQSAKANDRRIIRTKEPGPIGWNTAIMMLLKE
jgi:mannosyl-3-phosphoglycerate phosphatase